ncbi:MAG TPA: hypothetical protein VNT79_10030 [Phycisphaerae bacterium]|nr:hypothetical protein [Phycisphaerae bacterium]
MSPHSRAWWLGLAGLLLTLAALPAYALTMDQPFLRSTGLVAWTLVAAGLTLALVAVIRTRRRAAKWILGVHVALVIFAFYAFFGFARLPRPSMLAADSVAPAFTLPSSSGEQVSLARLLQDGPVLLAFYRGEW